MKIPDLDLLRRTIVGALPAAGWPEPMCLATTVDDRGSGQGRRDVRDRAELAHDATAADYDADEIRQAMDG